MIYYNTVNKSSDNSSSSSAGKTVTDEAKKCPKCGAEIKEGFLFCESCGTKL